MDIFNKGLFGWGGLSGGTPAMKPGILSDYFNPEEMRRQQMKQMLLGAGIGLLSQGPSDKPISFGQTLGAGLAGGLQAANQAGNAYTDNAFKMAEWDMRQQDRARELEKENQIKKAIGILTKDATPEELALAEAYPENFVKMKTSQMFPDQNNNGFYGSTAPVLMPDGTLTYAQPSKSGQWGINGQPMPKDARFVTPEEIAQMRASGGLAGKAPEVVVNEYVTKIRPQMQQTKEALASVQTAKRLLDSGIQTGSGAEMINALRGWGATVGLNVDESVLSNTQAYQNFIGNVVIPKMQALGGNDSNEEMRKMYSLSGGDITQAAEALRLTLDYTEKLMLQRYASFKGAEDTAKRYLPPEYFQDSAPLTPPAQGGTKRRRYNQNTGAFEDIVQ